MKSFSLILKLIAPVFVLVGALHLVMGLGADVMLGANLSPDSISDPALDSQNRFYGVAFSIYGVLFYVCSNDVKKYATIIYCLLWVFFIAGLARLVSIALYGFPPPLVGALLVTEIALPPVLLVWMRRIIDEDRQ